MGTDSTGAVMVSGEELRALVTDAVAAALVSAGFGKRKKPAPAPLAYNLSQAARASSLGRTSLCEAIKTGQLRALKRGVKTVVLDRDLRRWLDGLPPAGRAA
jgi:hypothetical protein